MSTRYIPFESKSGFKSPGFLVNEFGDLLVSGNIDTTGSFKLNGVPIIDQSDSIIALDPVIQRALGLKELGTLEYLNIDGDFTIAQGSTPYFSVINGNVRIQSTTPDHGNMDNMDIGVVDPGLGYFTNITVGSVTTPGNATVYGDVDITNTPVAPSHATRKDYVDARISAFAIAFGA